MERSSTTVPISIEGGAEASSWNPNPKRQECRTGTLLRKVGTVVIFTTNEVPTMTGSAGQSMTSITKGDASPVLSLSFKEIIVTVILAGSSNNGLRH